MNKFKLILIGICSIGLAACGDYVAEEDKEMVSASAEVDNTSNLSNYPEGVQNGLVTKDYYLNINLFNEQYLNFRQNGFNLKDQPEKTEDSRKQVILDFLLYINSMNGSPSTKAEYELDEYFTSVVYYAENEATYALEYLNRKEDVYRDLYLDSRESFMTNFEIFGAITDKYYINY